MPKMYINVIYFHATLEGGILERCSDFMVCEAPQEAQLCGAHALHTTQEGTLGK